MLFFEVYQRKNNTTETKGYWHSCVFKLLHKIACVCRSDRSV